MQRAVEAGTGCLNLGGQQLKLGCIMGLGPIKQARTVRLAGEWNRYGKQLALLHHQPLNAALPRAIAVFVITRTPHYRTGMKPHIISHPHLGALHRQSLRSPGVQNKRCGL